MSDDLCPDIRILQIPSKVSESKSCILKLKSNPKLQKINRIVYDVDEKIYLRLLTCKDVKDEECNPHQNRDANQITKKICDESLNFSYIYYNMANTHYLAVFIPSASIDKHSENIKELIRVIEWLNLNSKKIFFEVFHYGKPFNQLRSSTIKNNFSNEIRKSVQHKLYETGEEICFMTYLNPDYTVLKFPKDKPGRLLVLQ